MASTKDLKKRIVSTKSTQQTTKAMKMVSAAKLRRAQDAITSQRPYANRIKALIQLLASTPNLEFKSPLIQKELAGEAGSGKRLLLLVVTSDRGLCGGFNANVIKGAQRWIEAHRAEYSQIELTFVGRRGFDFFKTRSYKLSTNHAELGGKVTFAKARKLADFLTSEYLSDQFDEVKVIYNVFRNAITQETTVEDFLPLANMGMMSDEDLLAASNLIIKPSPQELLADLLGKYFGIQAFRIMLESQAGEHGARMSAMENATKNAEEMVRSLTLEYNKQRQAGITKELLEIISGSESQKAS